MSDAAENYMAVIDQLTVERDSLRAALERIANDEMQTQPAGRYVIPMSAADIARQALTSSEKENVDPGVIGTVPATKPNQLAELQAIDAMLAERTSLRAALERLAKIDPFITEGLPFIDCARDLQARIEFAAQALTSSEKEKA